MNDITRVGVAKRYSECVVFNGVVYLSGQVDEQGLHGIEAQTRQVLKEIDELLGAVGSHKDRILQATIHLTNMGDYAGMNAVWDEWVTEGKTPARTTVQSQLADPKWLIEIAVVAAINVS